MDYLLIGFGALLMIAGILGGVLPVIPGPPLSYAGLLLLHFTEAYHFSNRLLIVWAMITVVVTLLDYAIPVWGTKKFGGSRRGVWGSVIGLIVGLFFFPPFGIIAGPFLGAVLGELTAGKDSAAAFRSGFGSFAGFLTGTLLKVITSGWMTWHFAKEIITG